MAHVHRYSTTCSWTGSTAEGYAHYDRSHELSAPPAEAVIAASGDPHFGGDGARLNPEQLLVMAASSCQMLSFLAICARARIDIRVYEDRAEGVMPEDDPPTRITKIVLRPRVTVGDDTGEERLRRYTALAHEECFIAQSLKTRIEIEPEFSRATTRPEPSRSAGSRPSS